MLQNYNNKTNKQNFIFSYFRSWGRTGRSFWLPFWTVGVGAIFKTASGPIYNLITVKTYFIGKTFSRWSKHLLAIRKVGRDSHRSVNNWNTNLTLIYFSIIKRVKKMSGLNPVDVVEEDAADLLFPKGLYGLLNSKKINLVWEKNLQRANINSRFLGTLVSKYWPIQL